MQGRFFAIKITGHKANVPNGNSTTTRRIKFIQNGQSTASKTTLSLLVGGFPVTRRRDLSSILLSHLLGRRAGGPPSLVSVKFQVSRHCSQVVPRDSYSPISSPHLQRPNVHVTGICHCHVCVFMVIEHVRRMTPFNHVYIRYLDVDMDAADKVVMSPITLIAGCAIPCWMSAIVGIDRTNGLALFGVLVLGVGDSMADIVGTHYGKTKWGRKRTVEGSFAMGMSMLAICWACGRMDWTVAVIVTTILEAFTCQIDNLVLALTGATVVMIQSGWATSFNQMDKLVLPLITVAIAVAVINMLWRNHQNASDRLSKVARDLGSKLRLEDSDLNKHKEDFTCKEMFISNVSRDCTDESKASIDLRLRPRGMKLNGETCRTLK